MLALLLLVGCTSDTATVSEPDSANPTVVVDTGDSGQKFQADSGESGPHGTDTGGDSALETGAPTDTGDTGESLDTTPPDWCPQFADPAEIGLVDDAELNELSGVVESRQQAGVLWTHNDSGDTERFFALDRSGALLGTWEITGEHPRDLEDLAIGLGPDGESNYLYLGDVGDNTRTRETVRVLRFPEPILDLEGSLPITDTVEPEFIELEFHDGIQRDSEAIFIDPLTGDLFLVIKDRDGKGISGVFRAQAPFGPESVAPLVEVAELLFGGEALPGSNLTTGADMSSDGEWIVIRSYSAVFLWWRDPTWSVGQAFEHNACPAPAASEPQGEAVGFAANGRDYITLSERVDQPVWLYTWEH